MLEVFLLISLVLGHQEKIKSEVKISCTTYFFVVLDFRHFKSYIISRNIVSFRLLMCQRNFQNVRQIHNY